MCFLSVLNVNYFAFVHIYTEGKARAPQAKLRQTQISPEGWALSHRLESPGGIFLKSTRFRPPGISSLMLASARFLAELLHSARASPEPLPEAAPGRPGSCPDYLPSRGGRQQKQVPCGLLSEASPSASLCLSLPYCALVLGKQAPRAPSWDQLTKARAS